MSVFASIDDVQNKLSEQGYVCSRALATVVFLSLKLGRPLFLEGEAGVGKTEIAKAMAAVLGRKLIRLQCYEGLDASSAVYEWNFPAQMVAIRTAEAAGDQTKMPCKRNCSAINTSSNVPCLRRCNPMKTVLRFY